MSAARPSVTVSESGRPLSRRAVLGAVLATAAGLTAAGCGSGSTSSGDGESSFTYWSMWKQDEPQAKVLKAAIAQFTKDTGVKVSVQWKGRQVVQQLAPTLNTSNVPADLVDSADRFAYAQLQATGQAFDLTPVLDLSIPGEKGHTVGGVIPAKYRDLSTTDGTLWQIPYEVVTTQVWYDGHALPDVAAQPPATWAEFTDLLATRRARRGDGPLALDADVPDYAAYWTYYAVLRGLGPGAFAKAAKDKSGALLKADGFVDALRHIEKLVSANDFTKGYDGSKWPAVQQKWAKGKSDFLLLGTFAPSETAEFATSGFTYRSFPFPAFTAGDNTAQDISLIGFSIPKKARNTAAAQKFIAYFLAKEHLSGIASQAKNITPRADIAAPTELADAQKALSSGTVVKTLDGVKETAAEWYTKVFLPLNTEFITGRLTAKSFAGKLADGSAAYWKTAS
ncbi:ABC transporter substrate-binding protein [Streptomyces arenae]|uniref:ABC transporter substrate-binding protein n=1 Tax=Streptomyces arenae TaxID=29301 RepID=UPI002658A74D|nr:ABC transporter substrate-binding protein [Streptomyces arenae]MCG7203557.1 ABC transporter substrate-binding protein [Streptomyces arenae]